MKDFIYLVIAVIAVALMSTLVGCAQNKTAVKESCDTIGQVNGNSITVAAASCTDLKTSYLFTLTGSNATMIIYNNEAGFYGEEKLNCTYAKSGNIYAFHCDNGKNYEITAN